MASETQKWWELLTERLKREVKEKEKEIDDLRAEVDLADGMYEMVMESYAKRRQCWADRKKEIDDLRFENTGLRTEVTRLQKGQ